MPQKDPFLCRLYVQPEKTQKIVPKPDARLIRVKPWVSQGRKKPSSRRLWANSVVGPKVSHVFVVAKPQICR